MLMLFNIIEMFGFFYKKLKQGSVATLPCFLLFMDEIHEKYQVVFLKCQVLV